MRYVAFVNCRHQLVNVVFEMDDCVVNLNHNSLLTPLIFTIMRTTAFRNSKRIKWSAYRNYSFESFTFLSNPKANSMKTFVFILFTVIISSQTFAQETSVDYLDVDREKSTPKEVLKLAETASDWDVSKSTDYDSRNKPFTVVFKSNKGFIELTYDRNGRVIQSNEVFKKVNMPTQLTLYVLRQYPEYKIVDNKYKYKFEIGKVTESSYSIVLQNGDEKKHLLFHNRIN